MSDTRLTSCTCRLPTRISSFTTGVFSKTLSVTKQRVSAGEVIIRKEVITETQLIEVPVRREELVIERHDAEGNVAQMTGNNARELRIVLGEERVAVGMRPVVREVVRVSRRQVWERRAVSEVVRHEELRSEEPGREDARTNRDASGNVERAA